MYSDSLFPEDLDEVKVEVEEEQCPECGHIWIDDEQHHYHDCRYFLLSDEAEDDDFFESGEEENPTMKSWEYRPAA
jgi:Zn-finger nucleic acid-binding protein